MENDPYRRAKIVSCRSENQARCTQILQYNIASPDPWYPFFLGAAARSACKEIKSRGTYSVIFFASTSSMRRASTRAYALSWGWRRSADTTFDFSMAAERPDSTNNVMTLGIVFTQETVEERSLLVYIDLLALVYIIHVKTMCCVVTFFTLYRILNRTSPSAALHALPQLEHGCR